MKYYTRCEKCEGTRYYKTERGLDACCELCKMTGLSQDSLKILKAAKAVDDAWERAK